MNTRSFTFSSLLPAAALAFARIFIHLGLPLLGWGAGDYAAFLAHPVRLAYAVLVMARALLDGALVAITPPHPGHEHRFDLASWHAHAFEIIFVLAAYGDRRDVLTWSDNLPLRWAGLGTYLVGALLTVWANLVWIRHLWSAGPQALPSPALLTSGPFRWTRYPTLVSLVIYCLGFVFMFRSWIGLVLMLPLGWGALHHVREMENPPLSSLR